MSLGAAHEPSSRNKASTGRAKDSAAASGSKAASHPWTPAGSLLVPTVARRIPRAPSHSAAQRLRPTTQTWSSGSAAGTSKDDIPGRAHRSSIQSASSSSAVPSHASEARERQRDPQGAGDPELAIGAWGSRPGLGLSAVPSGPEALYAVRVCVQARRRTGG